jgi:hypothetical protein
MSVLLLSLFFSIQQFHSKISVSEIGTFDTPNHLAIVELDTSGELYFLAITDEKITVLNQSVSFQIPGRATLYTAADFDNNNREEFWMLIDGQSLCRLVMKDGALEIEEPLVKGLRAMPPTGVHVANFLVDLNGDNLLDLSLPVADRVRVHLNSDTGFLNGIELGTISQLNFITGEGLLGKVGRVISVPTMVPEDVSGDGDPDLVITDGGVIRQYISQNQSFPSSPTKTFNTYDFLRDTSDFELDLSNVAKGMAYVVQDKWADFDDDGDLDVMILSDHKIRIFLGDEDGINIKEEAQRLKVRGNVIFLYPARINGDAYPDLVLVRVEDLGLGKILRAALMSWEVNFDFMVFLGNGDGTFQRRASKIKSAQLYGDSLISTYKQGKEELSTLRKRILRISNMNKNGGDNDIVKLNSNGLIEIYEDIGASKNILSLAIEKFLAQSLAGDEKLSLEINELTEWLLGRTSALASLVQGVNPRFKVQLPDWKTPHAMIVRDLDADGVDEAVVFRKVFGAEEVEQITGFMVDFN